MKDIKPQVEALANQIETLAWEQEGLTEELLDTASRALRKILGHRRTAPPKYLKWSGKEVPSAGDHVKINCNNLGSGTVVDYFHQAGYLGVKVELTPETIPDWFKRQNGDLTTAHLFGAELIQ